jgi:RNA polymerase sigma factor (sigma-70 family)
LSWLHRVAFLLCQDWSRADDLVQVAITRLYVNWRRASGVENLDGYTRTILVRVYLAEQRSGWGKRVTALRRLPETAAVVADPDVAMDLRAALAGLAPRQRAAVVLRFYCDLSIEQTADAMNCSTGTVKSQTSRALTILRGELTAADLAFDKEHQQ